MRRSVRGGDGWARGRVVRSRRAPAPAGAADRPRRRPVGALAVAAALAAVLLVAAAEGGVATGVVTLASPDAAPAQCRDVTLFAVNGSGAGGGDTLAAVTDPLVQRVGERLAVVAVTGPEAGASYTASEQQAAGALTDQVAAQLAACPTGRAMLFGYSQGAQVAGDVASRIGAGQEPRVPADRVLAVGLFGDPARDPAARTVPDGVAGQGVLPARAGGFGALGARTIEVCAPGDPVCAAPAGAPAPQLEQAVAAPAHIDYPELAVAPDTPAPRWASDSLGRLITSLPAGTPPATSTTTSAAPGSGAATTGTSTSGSSLPYPSSPGTSGSGGAAAADGAAGSGSSTTGSSTTGSSTTGSSTPYPSTPSTSTPATVAPGAAAAGTGASSSTVPYTSATSSAHPGADTGASAAPGAATAPGGAVGGATTTTTATGAPAAGTDPGGATDGGAATGTGTGTASPTGTGSGAAGEYRPADPYRPGDTATGTDAGAGGVTTTTAPGAGSTATGDTATDDTEDTPGSTTPPDEASGTGRGRGGTGRERGGGDRAASPDRSGSRTAADPTTTTTRTSTTITTTTSTSPSTAGEEGATSRDGGSGTRGSAGRVTGAVWSLTSGLAGFQQGTAGNVEGGGLAPREVESPDVPGRRVVALQVPQGAKRSEVRPEAAQHIEAGQHLFFGYSAFLPADFPVGTRDWQVVWQLHDGGTDTSPPVALEIVGGHLWLSNVGDRVRDLGSVQAGRDLRVQMDVRFARGGGSVSVYRDGQPVLQGFHPPRGTMIDSFDFLKTGIYRDPGGDAAPATLFLDDLKIGDTLASVSGLAGAPPPPR